MDVFDGCLCILANPFTPRLLRSYRQVACSETKAFDL